MKPLNYAILKYFTTINEACADDVIEALKGQYGNFKALRKPAVVEAYRSTQQSKLNVVAFQYHPEEFNCKFATAMINKLIHREKNDTTSKGERDQKSSNIMASH